MTVDSDCVLHSPVTPDLLFDSSGKLLLPHSFRFQGAYWLPQLEYFTGPKTYHGHFMVSQPVSFARATLPAYRAWIRQTAGSRQPPLPFGGTRQNASRCYLDEVSDFIRERSRVVAGPRGWTRFCWMCQLGTFLQLAHSRAALVKLPPSLGQGWSQAHWRMHAEPYNLQDLDERRSPSPYMRFAAHVSWEPNDKLWRAAPYARKAAAIVEAGLCRALGNASSRLCMNESSHTSVRRELIDDMSFRYCEFSWGEPRHRESRIGSYLEHLWRAERASRAVAT